MGQSAKKQYGILANEIGNVKSISENTELLKQVEVKGTPFRMTGNDEDGWVPTLGMYRVGDVHETQEKLKVWLEQSGNWQLLTNVISVVVEETLKLKAEGIQQELLTTAKN